MKAALAFDVAFCTQCGRMKSGGKTGIVGNLLRHAATCAPDRYKQLEVKTDDLLRKWSSHQDPIAKSFGREPAHVWSKKMEAVARILLASSLAETRAPLSSVGNNKYRAHYALISGGHLPRSRFTVRRDTILVAASVRDRVQALLAASKGYCLMSDGWTGKGNVAYFVITLTTIDADTGKMMSLILDMHELPDTHTSDVMTGLLFDTAKQFKLNSKQLVSVIGDGAAAQRKAMTDFCIEFKGEDVSVHCLAHFLQLCFRFPLRKQTKATRSGRSEMGPADAGVMRSFRAMIDAAAAVAQFLAQSPGAAKLLKTRCVGERKSLDSAAMFSAWALIRFMPTRWDAVCRMLRRLLDLEDPLRSTLEQLVGKSNVRAKVQLENLNKVTGSRSIS